MEDPPQRPQSTADEPEPKKPKMSTTTTSDDDDTTATITEKKIRYKRRKIAIFFAYCGLGYQGMQKNPGAKTIEGDLEEALYLSGAVPEQDRGQPKRYDWARSARTDKGVSAVGQVVSGRFYVDPPGLVDRLNANLAPQIRIFGYKRVTASFNAKKFCDRRRYVYLIPVFALDPSSHPNRESVLASLGSGNELAKCLECSERGRKVVGLMGKRCFESKTWINGSPENLNGEPPEDAKVSIKTKESKLHGETVNLGVSSNEGNTEINIVTELNVNGKEVSNCEPVEEPKDSIETSVSELHCESMNRAKVFSCDEREICNDEPVEDAKASFEAKEYELQGETVGDGCGREMVKGESNLGENGDEKCVKQNEFSYGERERERFNRILRYYVGTHNFHNFTTRTKAEDPSARRYIISFEANKVVTVEGIDFVKCEVIGQSFMLHQIRKMIGLAVAVMRNCAPESIFEKAFQQDVNINVPTAPEVGLFLDECIFASYNQKWRDSHEELSMKSYEEEAEDFKMKQIYSHIASTEHKEGAVALWLHSLNHRNYPDLYDANEDAPIDGRSAQEDNMAE
ncbi:Pseudouridine synthase I, TruA, alpha/beta domain [Dillenia turbinata]|uniref:Pseudouridine synthase I, TruA, alpha/beta domain n=1 Tax=Dillenia turbinata TaxID=194707 RepID=A0AAN8W311_9MAGN